jgi:hypothetical protein
MLAKDLKQLVLNNIVCSTHGIQRRTDIDSTVRSAYSHKDREIQLKVHVNAG